MHLKYVDTAVVFSEFPNEITLAVNISNCPIHCDGCSSKWLWEDNGCELNEDSMRALIEKNEGVSCVGLMGGDSDHKSINKMAKFIKENFTNLKVGWYSGLDKVDGDICTDNFDYIKLGPYKIDRGPLNSQTTNQRMYEIRPNGGTRFAQLNGAYAVDVTNKFWKKKI